MTELRPGHWTKLLKKSDQMAARERIRCNYEQGLTISENLKKAKKVTAGVVVSSGKHRVGKDVCTEIRDRKRRRIEKEVKDKQKEVNALNSLVEKARQVWAVQTDVTKMTNKQLLTILCPLRQKDDAPMPSRKDQLLNQYAEWKHCLTPDMIYPPLSATAAPPPSTTAPPPPRATAPPPSESTPSPPSVAPLPSHRSATAPPPTSATAPPQARAMLLLL